MALEKSQKIQKEFLDGQTLSQLIHSGETGNIDAQFTLGTYYYDKQNYNQAISDYDSAIQINPNFAEAYYNRGNSYKAIGDNARAQADFKRAKELGFNG